jgi:hypothetical protein
MILCIELFAHLREKQNDVHPQPEKLIEKSQLPRDLKYHGNL